jgi:hypothetical protein
MNEEELLIEDQYIPDVGFEYEYPEYPEYDIEYTTDY